MSKKDKDISDAQDRYLGLKDDFRSKQDVINEKQDFLSQQVEGNESTEKRLTEMERALAKFKTEEQESVQSLELFQDELEVLRNTLNKSASIIFGQPAVLTRTLILQLPTTSDREDKRLTTSKTN